MSSPAFPEPPAAVAPTPLARSRRAGRARRREEGRLAQGRHHRAHRAPANVPRGRPRGRRGVGARRQPLEGHRARRPARGRGVARRPDDDGAQHPPPHPGARGGRAADAAGDLASAPTVTRSRASSPPTRRTRSSSAASPARSGSRRASRRARGGSTASRSAAPGKVALVLGAGNVSSIPPMDVLYKLFVENEVVVCKMNPVNAHVGAKLERAFKPLIDGGCLAIGYGGAQVGAHLAEHPQIDTLHVTGSDRTYDAIVWGADPEEQKRRKARGEPKNAKPVHRRARLRHAGPRRARAVVRRTTCASRRGTSPAWSRRTRASTATPPRCW